MKIIPHTSLVVILVFLLLGSALAQSEMLTCRGKYVMGDLDTKKKARELALMNAKRMAMEEAGTYLESSSEVRNFELTQDEVHSLASGVIAIKVLEEEWKLSGENLMVTVLIRATVDTSNLSRRLTTLKQNEQSVEEHASIQNQLAQLQAEIERLKAQQPASQGASAGTAATPSGNVEREYAALTQKMTTLDQLRNAQSAMIGGRLSEAIDIYTTVIDENPRMADAYRGKAVAYARTGRAQEGLALIERALSIAPDNALSHGVRSFVMGKMGNYDQALLSINTAISMAPQNPSFYLGRAKLNMKLRKRQQALKDFSRSCTLGNQDACNIVQDIQKRTKRW